MSHQRIRDRILFRACAAAGCASVAALASWPLLVAERSRAASPAVSVFPIAGGHVAAPRTQITFRGVPAAQLGTIAVTGSSSGPHGGRIVAHSDGLGGSFLPSSPFKPGERVTVRTSLNVVGGRGGTYSFTIADPAGRMPTGALRAAKRVKGDVMRFVSRGFAPPAVKVNGRPARAAQRGGIFVAPQQGPIQQGPMILGPYGGLVWFQPVRRGDVVTDFRVQALHGNPVLTWWQGNVNGGVGQGVDEIYDSAYRLVATVRARNGLSADLHEFEITPQNTALITAYYPVYWNASSVKGSRHQIVLDSVVQEIDIATGLVLFQWDSLDHVPLTDGYAPSPKSARTPYDTFHINSVQQDSDGNLIVSARNTWTVYKIARGTGRIIWQLGGKRSSFKMTANTRFAFQHDARMHAGNVISLFDDGAGPPVVHKQSRALTLTLDTKHMTATMAGQDQHRPGLLAAFEGNVQIQPNGDSFVGWGQQPYFTEFNRSGKTVFDAHFVGANSTYRAYRFDWHTTPARPPDAAVRVRGRSITVYATWNGATQVAAWVVLGGTSSATLKPVGLARKRDFETAIRVSGSAQYVVAQALDGKGHVLGSSALIKVR